MLVTMGHDGEMMLVMIMTMVMMMMIKMMMVMMIERMKVMVIMTEDDVDDGNGR